LVHKIYLDFFLKIADGRAGPGAEPDKKLVVVGCPSAGTAMVMGNMIYKVS